MSPSDSTRSCRPDAPSAAGAFRPRIAISEKDHGATRTRARGVINGRRPIADVRLAAGFTLIELLVVVVIVGVLAAALVIAIGGSSERQLANASDRFQALLGHACNQAELTGREIGVALSAGGYAFSRLDRDEWRAFGNEGELRARTWPAGMRLELTNANRVVALATPGHDTPQLVCFSSGEMTPFALVLGLGDSAVHYRIDGKDDGTLKSIRVEEPK